MNESREKLFFHWSDSSQKFDYYVTGLAAAAVVYLTKEHHPSVIGVNPPSIELFAIISLAISLFAGLTQIERAVTILRVTHDLAPKEEFLRRLRQRKKGESFASESTPNVDMTEMEIEDKINSIAGVVNQAKQGRDRLTAFYRVCYSVRNIGLMLGIILLMTAKALTPYLD